ncbi:MAG: hypothetical protein DRQ44_16345, partial [Gammaproteobacteria bacterium]
TLSIALPLALAVTSNTAFAAEKTIRFLHINDLHAHLMPHADRVAGDNGSTVIEERGGIARLATLLKQQRTENPDNVVMNIGDTFHGGAEAMFSLGNAIVEPVNALNIDVGVAGNWDFAFSPGLTRLRFGPIDLFSYIPEEALKIGFPGNYLADPIPILRPNYPNLGANVKDIAVPFWDLMPATYVKEVNGVKIGFIGLTSDIIEDMHVFMAIGLQFTKGEDANRQLINKHAADLRANGADIVVLMSELGIHKDNALAQVIEPGSVDVIFSAHTHETTFSPLTSTSGAIVVEAGNDGWLGQMDITVDDENNIINKQWDLLAIDSSITDDADMQVLVDAARAPYLATDVHLIAPPFMTQKLTQPIDTIVGHTDTTVDRKDALESTFNAGWTDMIRQLTESDAAISPGFRMDATLVETGYMLEDNTLATGDITLEDAYRLFPVVYLMAKGEIDGAGIRTVIENQLTATFSSDVFNHVGGWNFGVSGLDITLNLDGTDGSRISSMSYSDTGETVLDSDIVTVGGCLRSIDTPDRLCSIPGFSGVLPVLNPADNQPLWTALDAFVYGLSAQNFNGSRVSINDESATPRWPEDDFIQPLNGVGTTSSDNSGNGGRFPRFDEILDEVSNNDRIGADAAGALGNVSIIALLGLMLVRRKFILSK